MLARGVNISGMFVQVITTPKHRSTHISNYRSNERESHEHDETSMTEILICPRERFSSYKTLCSGLSLATKGIGPSCCSFFTIVTCYSLRIILSHNYLLPIISVLPRIPCWKPLVNSFCSSLGSTLLLIERTMIDPLHLWVIIARPKISE